MRLRHFSQIYCTLGVRSDARRAFHPEILLNGVSTGRLQGRVSGMATTHSRLIFPDRSAEVGKKIERSTVYAVPDPTRSRCRPRTHHTRLAFAHWRTPHEPRDWNIPLRRASVNHRKFMPRCYSSLARSLREQERRSRRLVLATGRSWAELASLGGSLVTVSGSQLARPTAFHFFTVVSSQLAS